MLNCLFTVVDADASTENAVKGSFLAEFYQIKATYSEFTNFKSLYFKLDFIS